MCRTAILWLASSNLSDFITFTFELSYLTAYKMHWSIYRSTPISAGQIKKKQQQSTDVKRDEIDIMNIINNTFYLHYNLFNI